MATTITQRPLYSILPVGQDIIFTVSNPAVTTFFNVKFIAEVYISNTLPSTATADLVGTFKTTPNTVGVGIFDFSAVVENHVKSDNLSLVNASYYKTVLATPSPTYPIHITDKWSPNSKAMAWMIIKFSMEGSITATGIPEFVQGSDQQSVNYEIFNGYLKYTEKLNTIDNDFGFDLRDFQPAPVPGDPRGSTKKFLTNASTTQYANVEDYGTVALLNQTAATDYMEILYYDSTGAHLSGLDDTIYTYITSALISDVRLRLLYFGCFPANLHNWSANFAAALLLDLSYYTVRAFDEDSNAVTKSYTININCPTLKGYVPIRLAWLNQWGVWDYYTFTKKSSRTISTKGSTYTQLEGTWNEAAFRLNGYRGGKKAFRVNATEKIKMNTDFVNESESEWFEELINSPEVYMLEGFQTDSSIPLLNTYVTPVRLTTSSYTRKTIANDKLMQYTFEVEKSKTLRTQAV